MPGWRRRCCARTVLGARRPAEAALTPDDSRPCHDPADDQQTEVVDLTGERPPTLEARARALWVGAARMLSAGWVHARQIPAALLLALPFSLVAGLVAGALIPTVAARATQVTGGDEVPVHLVEPLAASTLAAQDAARPEPANGTTHKKRKKHKSAATNLPQDAATAVAEVGDDLLGTGDEDGTADAAVVSRSADRRRGKLDPADPSLIYRFPTVTGRTVSPPARVTRQIAATLPLPAESGKGRRIVYSSSQQHLWIVDVSGAVLRDYPVTGRVDRPGVGTYRVYSMSRASYNPVAKVSFTHMVRFAHGVTGAAIGFHGIPRWENGAPLQTEESLGLALGRGGCIRQTVQNAKFLYRWADVGDRVVVVA